MNGQNGLAEERCDACKSGAPQVTDVEIEGYLAQLCGWQVMERDQIKVLEKNFTFKNFAAALDFTNQVGEIAETSQHHPDILTAWGRVTVTWYTHKIGGLHRNDFRCAAKCDQLVT